MFSIDDDSFIAEEDIPEEWLAQVFDLASLNSPNPHSTHGRPPAVDSHPTTHSGEPL